MVRVDLELEGSAEDVVRGLRRIIDGAGMGTDVPELGHVLPPADEVTGSEATTDMPPVSTWTEAVATDFVGVWVLGPGGWSFRSGRPEMWASTAVRCVVGLSCLRQSFGDCW